jgi:hypothetical protein
LRFLLIAAVPSIVVVGLLLIANSIFSGVFFIFFSILFSLPFFLLFKATSSTISYSKVLSNFKNVLVASFEK